MTKQDTRNEIEKNLNYFFQVAYDILQDYNEAENVVHDSVVRFLKIMECQPKRIENEKLYIAKTVYRCAIDAAKEKASRIFIQDPNSIKDKRVFPNQTKSFEEKESIKNLEELLEHISPTYKALLHLRYSQKHSYSEIAEIMNLKSVNSARQMHYRAIKRLREIAPKRQGLFRKTKTLGKK